MELKKWSPQLDQVYEYPSCNKREPYSQTQHNSPVGDLPRFSYNQFFSLRLGNTDGNHLNWGDRVVVTGRDLGDLFDKVHSFGDLQIRIRQRIP